MALTVKEVPFKKLEMVSPTKIDLVVEGLDGSGKTFFGLTGPGPIAHHDLMDNGLHRALQGFSREQLDQIELYPFDYDFTHTLALPGTDGSKGMKVLAVDPWAEFVTNVKAAAEKCRTNIIDTGSAAWELLRLARMGQLIQVMPLDYTKANYEFKDLLQVLHKGRANHIWIHRLKPSYDAADKKVPNSYERQGFADIAYEVDAVVRLSYDEEGMRLRFGKCANRSLTGTVISGADNITFPKIATMIYPNTDKKHWE